MSSHRVVVDGSNIATEGRSLPSLKQLDEAVRAYRDEHPDTEIIVVVDATFAHRIDESERPLFEEAAAHNELVYPPAGAIGRGDAFLLRIADKTDAVVLSNDSFQEFHGEFEWLFAKGRLIGGTPVPGVGWIFVPRTPVRGPKSREAVKEAKRGKARIGSKEASGPMPVPKAPPPRSPKNKDAKGGDSSKPPKSGQPKGEGRGRLKAAIEEATEEAVSVEEAVGGGGGGKRKRRRRKGKGGGGGSEVASLPTVNEPLTFIQFIADHQPGASVDGEIESFASHGAFVLVGDARCYIPLSAMGDPPPRSAREVLNRGETRTFVVQALDAPRRGIELALPGFEHVAGQPTEETVEAEIEEAPPPISAKRGGRGGRGGRKSSTAQDAVVADVAATADAGGRRKSSSKSSSTKKAAEKATPAKKSVAKAAAERASSRSATTKKAATTAKKAPAEKAPAKAAAKKATAVTTAKKKAPAAAAKKGSAQAPAKTAAKKGTAKAPAKKGVVKAAAGKAPAKAAAGKASARAASPAKKAPTTPARKASATPTKSAAKKAPAKAAAGKAASKKAPAKKATKKASS